MRIFLSILLLFFINSCFAQLVLNNGVIINVAAGTSNTASSTLVLNNPPLPATAPPILQIGTITSQGIMLESEWNRLQYNLSTLTYSITVPYISNATGTFVPFPLKVYNITAGINAGAQPGAIRFSSTHAATMGTGWDNTGYEPSEVSDMFGAGCAGNNSANAVDRFWIIKPVYYKSPISTVGNYPAVTLDFTYLMGEANTNGGNSASLYSTLQPQRYDTTAACKWNGFPTTAAQAGTNTPGACCGNNVGTLTGVQVPSTQLFSDWTLSNYLIPLPVQIINYSGVCENKSVTLKWTSTNETNSNYYTLEKSLDGINFNQLTTLAASGNSNQNITYTYVDVSPSDNNTIYYRLSETDKNGNTQIFQTISVSNCTNSANENGTIYSYQNEVNISLFSLSNQNITVTAYDVTGRLIYQNQVFAGEGNNNIKLTPDLAQGIYLFELKTAKLSIVKRILIEH